MTQQQLIEQFIEGATDGVSGGSGNLKIKDNKLIHYNTIIAEKYNDKFILNITRYSLVTGRIQKMLKEHLDESIVITVRGVAEGCRDTLVGYIRL